MNQHITNAEWIAYLSNDPLTSERTKLFAKVHAHIGACPECRELHDRVTRVGAALNAMTLIGGIAQKASAFRAVADDLPGAVCEEYGALTIDIEAGARFLPETLSAEGDAEKYIFLCEDGDTRLVDDCDDETCLVLENGSIRLDFPGELGLCVTAELNDALYELDGNGHAVLPLPAGNCTLRVSFSAKE